MEGLKVSDANLIVHLHPSKSTKAVQAILRELSALLFKFSETFDGVLLAYDVNILDKYAKILPGVHPYFGVRLKAKLLLFSPKPDMLIEGKVVKLTEESIHVIVLGFSSAIITEAEFCKKFEFKIKHREHRFVSRSQKRHVIMVGTLIRFLIKSLDEEIMHIYGSLVPEQTGCIRWLTKNLADVSQSERYSKKRGVSDGEIEMGDLETVTEGGSSLSNSLQSRKSKKHRAVESQ